MVFSAPTVAKLTQSCSVRRSKTARLPVAGSSGKDAELKELRRGQKSATYSVDVKTFSEQGLASRALRIFATAPAGDVRGGTRGLVSARQMRASLPA
jgi:hypothetical protein